MARFTTALYDLVYTLVFSEVMKARMPDNTGRLPTVFISVLGY
jgi:hypothetical protein